MYLKGSKFNLNRRRRRSNPWRILVLTAAVAGAIYFNQVVVPVTPPLFIPTATATRSPESFVTDAENLLAQGKILPAIAAYETAIQADPKNATNFVTLARLQIYSGRYEEALKNSENALLLNPNNALAHAMRGWALGFLGDYLKAEAALKEAIRLDPNSAVAYAYYAEVLVLQDQAGLGTLGSVDKAIEASRTALAMAPNALETHRARGVVLEQTANYQEAATEFEAALAKNTNIADLHLALGRNYRYLEQYDKAVEEFTRANALNPTDPLPLVYISRTYATVGEFAKAIQYAQQAVKNDPTDATLYGTLGSMFYRNRQYREAVDTLQLVVRGGVNADGQEIAGLPLDYGRVAEYYSTYGLALARVGGCGEALQISQLLQEGVPNDENSLYNASEIVTTCRQLAQTPLVPTQLVSGTPELTGSETPTPEGGEATVSDSGETPTETTPPIEGDLTATPTP